MAYDTTEAVAKFLSGFQMKITNRERDTVAPDYYVKYSATLGTEWSVPTSTALKRMDSLIHSAHKPRPTGLRAMTLRR